MLRLYGGSAVRLYQKKHHILYTNVCVHLVLYFQVLFNRFILIIQLNDWCQISYIMR